MKKQDNSEKGGEASTDKQVDKQPKNNVGEDMELFDIEIDAELWRVDIDQDLWDITKKKL